MGYFPECIVFFALLIACVCDKRRPIYNIGHMVNSVKEIEQFLDLGANMLEFDVQFYENGAVKETHHGWPCDLGRECEGKANLKEYLKHVRKITDPSTTPKNYANQLIMLHFDLKLTGKTDRKESGRNLARHVLKYLWSKDGKRKQEVRALICIESISHHETIDSFIKEFKTSGQEARLKDVGFDGGSDDIQNIHKMFINMKVGGNIWLGDGITSVFSAFYSDKRMQDGIKIRNGSNSFIKKVYHWTIDSKFRMKKSLELGVDGIMTNHPQVLMEVMQDFDHSCRLATPDDNPFERYESA